MKSLPRRKPRGNPLRRGDRKTRGRSVAPVPHQEKPMANKKTAKKRAKKEMKKRKGC